jgi:CHRD domain
MRARLNLALLAVLAVVPAACGGGSNASTHAASGASGGPPPASRPSRLYTVRMSGTVAVPRGAPHGTGVAIIAFHGDSIVCWRFAHLHGFTRATSAHLHNGSMGKSGRVVVALSTGARLHHKGCTPISPKLARAIWREPNQYYVDIQSQQYPRGAVRAQL